MSNIRTHNQSSCAVSNCASDQPAVERLHSLFEHQVAAVPNRTAVVQGSRKVTYRELNERADRLAGELRRQATDGSVPIGVCLSPSVEAIAAILGVLKAGAAYVPLDPTQPRSRLQFVVQDTRMKEVVVDNPDDYEWSGADVRRITCESPSQTGTASTAKTESGDLAYLIYTSGSTGKPKGVQVSHSNAVYSTKARIQYYRKQVDRFLLLSPLTFDSSIAGLFWTLSTGGALVIPPNISETLLRIPELIAKENVTHLLCVPSLWDFLLEQNLSGIDDLQTVIVAGETCSPQLAHRHMNLLPSVKLYNEYGPTEASVWCSVHRVTPQTVGDSVPIGNAIPGTRLHILDEQLNPVESGESGELFVSGPGVVRGYLNRPELTAKCFLDNPNDKAPHNRLYRTGDIVQQFDHGLKFLGRRDRQVKINGYRIELGEIENALLGLKQVRESAVVAEQPNANSSIQLTAYVVPTNGVTLDKLRVQMAQTMPAYMLPHAIHLLPKLPRTAHGKVNFESLKPSASRNGNDASNVSSSSQIQNVVELQLTQIWQELLPGRQFDRTTDYFELDADSLSALRLLVQIQERFGRELTISDLMNGPTIAELACTIRAQATSANWTPIVPIQPKGERTPLFCVHPGGGNALCYLELSRCLGAGQPLYGLQAHGFDQPDVPTISVREMARQYVAAIRNVQAKGPYALAGWSFGGVVAQEMACELQADGQHVSFLGVLDAGIVYAVSLIRSIFPNNNTPLFQMLETDADELLADFRKAATPVGIIPKGASDEQAVRVLNVFRANAIATVDHRPRNYSGRLTLFRAMQPLVKTRRTFEDEWSRYCKDMEIVPSPGNHMTMLSSPHVAVLAERLRRRLDHMPAIRFDSVLQQPATVPLTNFAIDT